MISQKVIDVYFELFDRYFDGDPKIMPADDPTGLGTFGFVCDQDDDIGKKSYMGRCPFLVLKNDYPDKFKKLLEHRNLKYENSEKIKDDMSSQIKAKLTGVEIEFLKYQSQHFCHHETS